MNVYILKYSEFNTMGKPIDLCDHIQKGNGRPRMSNPVNPQISQNIKCHCQCTYDSNMM